jgi:hypothetical protein
MRFEYFGRRFFIHFERQHRHIHREVNSEMTKVGLKVIDVQETTYPDTIANIWEQGEDSTKPPSLFRTNRVGCHHTEKFNEKRGFRETGRIIALRGISRAITCHDFNVFLTDADRKNNVKPGTHPVAKGFRAAMWAAYTSRPRSLKG